MSGRRSWVLAATVAAAAMTSIAVVGSAGATAPPVGPLPKGPVSAISTSKGELVAVALPARAGGFVWRLARPVNPRVVQQVSETRLGRAVIVVFRATGPGTARVVFGLTLGETARAYASASYDVRVR